MLKRNNYIVFEASNAKEAEVAFNRESGEFNLVFSDIILPDRNGLQLIEKFLGINSDLKVLLCSGYTNDKANRNQIASKEYEFIQKPYGMDALLQAIGKSMGKS